MPLYRYYFRDQANKAANWQAFEVNSHAGTRNAVRRSYRSSVRRM